MSKVIMWNLMTLDGFFEASNKWDLDWHQYVWGEELEQLSIEQLESAEALLFGRVTYQGMYEYWSTATGTIADYMNRIPKLVFSRTLERAEWSNTRLVNRAAEEEVVRLRQQPGKNLLIFGSADLSSTLMRHGLIDEFRIGLVPVVLGSGTPLFKPGSDPTKLKLVESRPTRTGCVILYYRPEEETP